jgi:hypothetical protein
LLYLILMQKLLVVAVVRLVYEISHNTGIELVNFI